MPKAVWNGSVIAESNEFETVEGNIYFPEKSVHREFLVDSPTHSHCPWKGEASYFSLQVNGKTNADAAWYYPDPKPEAKHIKNHVAFWKGVEVVS